MPVRPHALCRTGNLRQTVLGAAIATALGTITLETRASDDADTLQLAIEFLERGEFEDASALFANVDRDVLDSVARARFDKIKPQMEQVAADTRRARKDLKRIPKALEDQDYEQALTRIAAVLGNDAAAPELKQAARSHMSMVQFRQRQHMLASGLQDPGHDRAERLHRAQLHMDQAAQAFADQDWQRAQDEYSLASWYWKEGALETVYVDPHDNAVFTEMPSARLHAVKVLVPVRNVTMNLNLGVGRLVGIETFQFSNAPVSGVGAGGFVQLPSVNRIQLKTTVTAPAVEVRPQTIEQVHVSDSFIALIRPRI